MSRTRRLLIFGTLALAQAGIVVCYLQFATTTPARATAEQPAPPADNDLSQVVIADPNPVPAPMAVAQHCPLPDSTLAIPAPQTAPPVAAAGPSASPAPAVNAPVPPPVTGGVVPPPTPGGDPLLTPKDARPAPDLTGPVGTNQPAPPVSAPAPQKPELPAPTGAIAAMPPTSAPAPPLPTVPPVGQFPAPPPVPSTASVPAASPAPPPDARDLLPGPGVTPKAAEVKAPPAPAKEASSPWTFHLVVVQGRNVLTAKVGGEVKFKITCDRLEMQAPHGAIQATGSIKLTSPGLEGTSERLTINLQDDRVILDGRSHLHARREGQEMELEADRLSLRMLGGHLSERAEALPTDPEP